MLHTKCVHTAIKAVQKRLQLTCLHSKHMKEHVRKILLSIEMFLSYYVSFVVANKPASLRVIYFLTITCVVKWLLHSPLLMSDVNELMIKKMLWYST